MANILALDTSTDACSVALHANGESHEIFKVIPRKHTHELLPMVQEILSQAGLSVQQLDAIAFSRGPGSFAGLRIATGVAQGLAFAADLPVVPVSTLAALAQGFFRSTETNDSSRSNTEVITALDARMDEVYWASFIQENGFAKLSMIERVSSPSQVIIDDPSLNLDYAAVGSGFNYLESMPAETKDSLHLMNTEVHPHAIDILQLACEEYRKGNTVTAENAQPVYLRNQVTWKKKDQQ